MMLNASFVFFGLSANICFALQDRRASLAANMTHRRRQRSFELELGFDPESSAAKRLVNLTILSDRIVFSPWLVCIGDLGSLLRNSRCLRLSNWRISKSQFRWIHLGSRNKARNSVLEIRLNIESPNPTSRNGDAGYGYRLPVFGTNSSQQIRWLSMGWMRSTGSQANDWLANDYGVFGFHQASLSLHPNASLVMHKFTRCSFYG